jgi:hypothetical protein
VVGIFAGFTKDLLGYALYPALHPASFPTFRRRAIANNCCQPGRSDHSSGCAFVWAGNFPGARGERAGMPGGVSDAWSKLVCRTWKDQSVTAGTSAEDARAAGQWDEKLANRARLGFAASRSARLLQTVGFGTRKGRVCPDAAGKIADIHPSGRVRMIPRAATELETSNGDISECGRCAGGGLPKCSPTG